MLPDLSKNNICQNKLTIKGSPRSLNQFIRDNKGSEDNKLSLEKSVPIPEQYDSETAVIWTEINWGMTKDIEKVFNSQSWNENGLYSDRTISFASQDIPVYPWLLNVAPLYPHIDFELEFIDMANYRYGKFTITDGKLRDINLIHKLDQAFSLIKKYYKAFARIKPVAARNKKIWTYIHATKHRHLFDFMEQTHEVSSLIKELDRAPLSFR